MKPEEIRNLTWEEIHAEMPARRRLVYHALGEHGPATIRELAVAMEWDPYSVGPRVTELYQLGLARLVGRDGRAGKYAAVPVEEAKRYWDGRRRDEQLCIGL
jgi:predicted transcriptional regulator